MVATTAANVWDTTTQTFHGGQEHRYLNNFVEDFSVTTNYLGTPKKALQAAHDALDDILHYPAADQEPAKTALAQFLWPTGYETHRTRLLLGNGASELIDLVVRKALQNAYKRGVQQPTWKPRWAAQYKEYERSAVTNGFQVLKSTSTERADLVCIVNPCNPTGDYASVELLKNWIRENVVAGGSVIIDESMQPWLSAEFRDDSLISQHDFLREMYEEQQVSVHIMHSWTKLWSCPGIRTGSVVCPTEQHCQDLKKIQVPWSVNGPALKFMEQVVRDEEYLQRTWETTTALRAYVIEQLQSLNHQWEYEGEKFLSWVWVKMESPEQAARAVDLARDAGVPVRSGKPGYACDSHVRVAVREQDKVQILVTAWKQL
ncbi:pyridoxal phosphate-dependent transferase [Radiomyces spectabilis]|uniref:pyridoxal phosphate-dependent transferase n=1 Tax=Radiomyces spectabilis TaxID=64574 RepID=UPI00221FD60F|nr:pyridoxal phosphate-dependent transferase [Radiomyces spectabilis]KAI8366088.1 pyridoxal phosphate-dependent transferase [Radiomyces spectabilis]